MGHPLYTTIKMSATGSERKYADVNQNLGTVMLIDLMPNKSG